MPSLAIDKLATVRDTLLAHYRYQVLRTRCALGKGSINRNEGKHLLILAWLFPPMITGGVYRPLSFARYAAERGWRVTVFAGPLPNVTTAPGEYLRNQLPESVNVQRVSPLKLSLSYRFFPQLDGGFDNVIATLETALACKALAPSIVLASGPPFHNFVAAWHLSRYFKAPLVLDYRDEWTQCPFDFVRSGHYDGTWEQRCLEEARSVIVTTNSFADQAAKAFPSVGSNKFTLIPNGFDPADIPTFHPTPPLRMDNKPIIEISFLGYLGDHTPPDSFIATLQKAVELRPDLERRVRIRFIGNIAPAIRERLLAYSYRGLILLTDQVPKPDALRIMQETDALLILNPLPLHRYIPGKLFDYVASGSPILVYGEGGEAANIVRELDAGQIVPEGDPHALTAALDRLANTPDNPSPEIRAAWLASHHRKVLADRLLDHLETLQQ